MSGPSPSPFIFSHLPGSSADPSRLALADTPPPWRRYASKPEAHQCLARRARPMLEEQQSRGRSYRASEKEAQIVSAALLLRRPILVTGDAGVGKSSLAYAVAWQLGLGNVLKWGTTSRSALKEALYQYDAIARLQDASLREKTHPAAARTDIGEYLTLGPLGTALLPTGAEGYFPRTLLIDEIDKSDADLPGDLLHVLEDGSFLIPEIARLPQAFPTAQEAEVAVNTIDPSMKRVKIPASGLVRCDDFPLIIMTSNGERDFPPAFLRRCLRLDVQAPTADKLKEIVSAHLGEEAAKDPVLKELVDEFVQRTASGTLATDQLLNIIQIVRHDLPGSESGGFLRETLLRALSDTPSRTL